MPLILLLISLVVGGYLGSLQLAGFEIPLAIGVMAGGAWASLRLAFKELF